MSTDFNLIQCQRRFVIALSFCLTGLVFAIGCNSKSATPGDIDAAAVGNSETVVNRAEAKTKSSEAYKSYRIHVPNMHCQSMCWPEVEESLMELTGVTSVILAKQKSRNKIDNKFVHVSSTVELIAEELERQLADWGYEDSKVESP